MTCQMLAVFTFLLLSTFVIVNSSKNDDLLSCFLPEPLKREIQGYRNFVNGIVTETINGKYSGQYYNDLSKFIDKFGNRLTGTQNLENSIEELAKNARNKKLKVTLEPVKVPHWERDFEAGYILAPRKKRMNLLGLGFSPSTGSNGVTGDVIVVSDFTELENRAKEVAGKIVLFNAEFTTYGETAKYRTKGPAMASKFGAVAALVRSVTPFSIYSPHTGTTDFGPNIRKIPAVCITLEDADLIARWAKEGHTVTVALQMNATLKSPKFSKNLLADFQGQLHPKQHVIVSGHIDSWDVGQGALDDGVGAFLALHSLYLLKSMNVPPPKRTIRAVLWTAEEVGLVGAKAYFLQHKHEIGNLTAALESDYGSSEPSGFNFEGSNDAFCVLQQIASLFENLNSTSVIKAQGVGSDISVFKSSHVPLIEPHYEHSNYMWFHHTDGDSMRALDSKVMDKNLVLFAAVSYILANLTTPLTEVHPSIWEVLQIK